MKKLTTALILFLASCSTLDPIKESFKESEEPISKNKFIVSNQDEKLDMIYEECVKDAEVTIKKVEVASKGVGGTVLLSGAAAVATGMAGAVSAVPVAVGLVVAGASTMRAGDSYKEYKGQLEVQECLEANGYSIIEIQSDQQ